MFAYAANNNNFGQRRNSVGYIERRVNDRKVVGSIPVLGINHNYLTGTLCNVED